MILCDLTTTDATWMFAPTAVYNCHRGHFMHTWRLAAFRPSSAPFASEAFRLRNFTAMFCIVEERPRLAGGLMIWMVQRGMLVSCWRNALFATTQCLLLSSMSMCFLVVVEIFLPWTILCTIWAAKMYLSALFVDLLCLQLVCTTMSLHALPTRTRHTRLHPLQLGIGREVKPIIPILHMVMTGMTSHIKTGAGRGDSTLNRRLDTSHPGGTETDRIIHQILVVRLGSRGGTLARKQAFLKAVLLQEVAEVPRPARTLPLQARALELNRSRAARALRRDGVAPVQLIRWDLSFRKSQRFARAWQDSMLLRGRASFGSCNCSGIQTRRKVILLQFTLSSVTCRANGRRQSR